MPPGEEILKLKYETRKILKRKSKWCSRDPSDQFGKNFPGMQKPEKRQLEDVFETQE